MTVLRTAGNLKRSVTAYAISLQALLSLYQKPFFKDTPEQCKEVKKLAYAVDNACRERTQEVLVANNKMVSAAENNFLVCHG